MPVPANLHKCSNCDSTNLVKNGFTPHGNQRGLCYDCGKSRVLVRKKSVLDEASLVRSFTERLSLCGVSRVFLISYYFVYQKLNDICLSLPNFRTQVADNKGDTDILEFDELCGFVRNKKNKQWLWAALSRKTRQIVAYVIGDRSEQTFRRLIRKIPIKYLKCQSFSDFWKSYSILKAKGNHRSGDPPTGW